MSSSSECQEVSMKLYPDIISAGSAFWAFPAHDMAVNNIHVTSIFLMIVIVYKLINLSLKI
jgi:hypothetical protein